MRHKPDELMAKVPLFEGLSAKELEQVSNLATRTRLPAGRELTRQGAPGHEFIIVLEGTVDVLVDGTVVASPGPGHFFGEVALLEHQPRLATVVTTSDVTVDIISQLDFAELLEDHPTIAERIREARRSYQEPPPEADFSA